MKKLIILTAISAFTFSACSTHGTGENKTTNTAVGDSTQLYACSMHPEVTGKKGEKCSKCGMDLTEPVSKNKAEHDHNDGKHSHDEATVIKDSVVAEVKPAAVATAEFLATAPAKASFSTNAIVVNYLKLKNALTKDDSKAAATASKALFASLKSTNTAAMDSKKKKEYLEIAESAMENAKHIGDNGGKIDHQREHFILLSTDIKDLIKTFGAKQKLYQDFCPMANDGKGAIWISEVKEIKNPYLGAQMPTCGTMQKTL